ncbi:MAG: hypothetical protein PVJ64_09240 [Gemmatimonadales bacterium]|jgi:hypothetical protein
MSIRYPRSTFASLAILLAACAAHQPEDETAGLAGGVEVREGAVVISGVTLDEEPGSLLNAMEGKVPNFRVQRLAGSCPQISLRTHVSFGSLTNPQIYVDGTRIADTCVLDSLRAQNVELVEVYPMGVTTRPGYQTHSYGLILVFMRSG